jgi:pimeloyl-ACP methyl ester carboxylesterase
MPKTKANGVSIHYITVGAGSDVVIVHAFLGNLAVGHFYMTPIFRREHCVTTYDLFGHGYSELTPTRYTTADEDLRCFLGAMSIDRPIMVGHNVGADIAMYLTLLYPERLAKLLGAWLSGLGASAQRQGLDRLDALGTIETPTLPVYGRNSQFISSYDSLHEGAPDCISVLGGEHFGPLEQPELLTAHIQQFLREPVPATSGEVREAR